MTETQSDKGGGQLFEEDGFHECKKRFSEPLKMTQAKLAKKYGVSRQAISLILNDEKSCEKLRKKKKEHELSAFLDILNARKERRNT